MSVRVTVDRLCKRYGNVDALLDVSLEVAAGECLALVGESGSGKTTLLRSINRLIEPDSGSVLLDGESVRAQNAVLLRRRIGYVPQEGGLLPHWRVARNVGLVPWLEGKADDETSARAMKLAGLDPATFSARWPYELSGGQRQRVAIARALAGGQSLLLLDEPFSALDAITRGELHASFQKLRTEVQCTVIIVTHDLREAMLLADRIAVLRAGVIEQLSAARQLAQAPGTDYVRKLVSYAGLNA